VPLPPTATPIHEPASRCWQPISEPTSDAIEGARHKLPSEENAPVPLTALPVPSANNRSEDPVGNDSGFGVTIDRGAGEDTDGESRGDEIPHAEPEHAAEETDMSKEMQRVLRGEDPDFQAPQPVLGRASHSRAQLSPASPKTNTKLKKNMKKGTLTLNHPPIPPSNPGRLDPKPNNDAVPVGKTYWILHPDYISQVVAYGKTGPHWKSKGQRLAGFCSAGQQMVQIHGVFATSVPLMFFEPERQPFWVLEDAVAPVAGSGVHVIWDTRYVVRYKVDALEVTTKLKD
jgi:hypothetical protein